MKIRSVLFLFLAVVPCLGMSWLFIPSNTGACPTANSTCNLWYDFSTTAKVTVSGGLVTAITDKSTAGNNAVQANPSFQFTYTASAINGLGGITNAATSSTPWMTMGSTIASTPQTMFFVFLSSIAAPCSAGNNATVFAESTGFKIWPGLQQNFELYDGTNNPFIGGVCANPGAATQWVTTDPVGGTLFYQDNTVLSSVKAAVDPSKITDINQFGTVTGVGDFLGSIGEIISYPSVLSSGDQTAVYTYLKSKWGTP